MVFPGFACYVLVHQFFTDTSDGTVGGGAGIFAKNKIDVTFVAAAGAKDPKKRIVACVNYGFTCVGRLNAYPDVFMAAFINVNKNSML